MFRLMGLTFWGDFRGPKEIWDKIHESPPVMTVPLILLAIPSVFLGMILGLPFGASLISRWLAPIFEAGESILRGGAGEPAYALFGIDGVLIIASVTIATIGLIVGWRLFGVEIGPIRLPARPERVRELTARAPFLYRASLNKWWFDDLYHLLFMVIGGRIAAAVWWFDREVIDGTVNAIGGATIDAGRGLRQVQTGRVQNYALGIAVGLIVMAGSYLLLAAR
jgi:NADH:ubiquinone oxidoreductase subunit 5 (subunit L)/multisubunit Na+/H+ antiporter MnhA subunit